MKTILFSLLLLSQSTVFAQQTTLVDKDLSNRNRAVIALDLGLETGRLINNCSLHGAKLIITSLGDSSGLTIAEGKLATKKSTISALMDISKLYIEDMMGLSAMRKQYLHDDINEEQEANLKALNKSVAPTLALLTNENNDCRNSYIKIVQLFKQSIANTK